MGRKCISSGPRRLALSPAQGCDEISIHAVLVMIMPQDLDTFSSLDLSGPRSTLVGSHLQLSHCCIARSHRALLLCCLWDPSLYGKAIKAWSFRCFCWENRRRMAGVIALFDVDGTLTAPRKVDSSFVVLNDPSLFAADSRLNAWFLFLGDNAANARVHAGTEEGRHTSLSPLLIRL